MELIRQILRRELPPNKYLVRYAVAIGCVLAALFLRWLLHPVLGNRSQYIIFLLAVLTAAWYSGSFPALLVLALGAFFGNFFFAAPYFAFGFVTIGDIAAIALYVIVGTAIIYLIEVVKRRENELKNQIIKQLDVETALRASEERFGLVMEALQGAVYDWDSVTDVAYRSPIIVEIVGYKANEVENTRKWWLDRMHPDDAERVQESLQSRIAVRAPIHSVEYRVRHKDGRYLWVWDKSRIIYGDDGQVRRLIGCTLSIDDRKQLAESLAHSEERFRLATEALQGLTYDVDLPANKVYRSSGLSKIMGYQPDEIPETSTWWHDQIHPDDLRQVQENFIATQASRAPMQSNEYRVRHKDGHYHWVWDSARILYNAEGQVVRMVGTTVSIDDRKQLAESLARSEKRFRLAFENASDAMAISDANGIVVAANNAYFNLYGYSAEEVIGHEFTIIFPEDQRAQGLARYHNVFNSPLQATPFNDSTVKRKDGSIRIVESRIGFVAPEGQRTYMLSVVRDLTERRQAEKAVYVRYELTTELAHAESADDAAQITVDYLMAYLGAQAGNIYTYQASDNMFKRLYENAPLSRTEITRWFSFAADPALPMTDVVKHNKPLWFSSAEEREAEYPSTTGLSPLVTGASVILPLIAASEVFGTLSFIFTDNRTFSADEKVFIGSLVYQCAQAIERARLAEKAKELAVIQERHRLARDLHDNVSQLLFSSSVLSEVLPRLLKTKPEKAAQQAEQIYLLVRGAMAEMRTLLWELRPENILQSPLPNLLTQLSYAARARQEIDIRVNVHGDANALLPPDVQVAFYRIVQESVHNMLKHSQASVISIKLRRTDIYTALIVTDNGQGFDPTVQKSGLGLQNMRERAAGIHALFDIQSQIGKGTRTRLLWIPNRRLDFDETGIENPVDL